MRPTPARKEPMPKIRSSARPSAEKKFFNPHTAQPNASAQAAVMKIKWKAFSDISTVGGPKRKITHGPEGQRHQAGEKERSEAEDSVDHFSLGNQVHEIPGHKKPF